MTCAPRRGRKTLFALIVIVASLPVAAGVTLEASTTDGSGGGLGSERLKVITAEGQAIIGAVRSGLTSLETGFLYSLRGGSGALRARLMNPKGQCALPEGRSLPVVGTVGGTDLKSWTLEAAAGHHPDLGFQPVASGANAASSAQLGVWSTAGLSGWQTLRLTAVDRSTGTVTSFAEVFLGDPADAFKAASSQRLAWPDVVKHLVRPCE